MARPFYADSVAGFFASDPSDIERRLLHLLAQRHSGRFQETIGSWSEAILIFRNALLGSNGSHPSVMGWQLAMEYPLPRLEKRIDAVLVTDHIIAVFEFKVGSRGYDATAIRQVEDYALDLRDFHSASHNSPILPVLIATRAPTSVLPANLDHAKTVLPVARCNAADLPRLLESVARCSGRAEPGPSDVDAWVDAPYKPTPSILEAAEMLYAGHNVREITHASADVTNLSDTTEAIFAVMEKTRLESGLAVCFVTGVPGSGKTLAGLNAVHDRRVRVDGVHGAYLSGNRPLVEVLRRALVADQMRRQGGTKGEAERAVQSEGQLLMGYLEEYVTRKPDQLPVENVIIFDEAQRAWDADFGQKKFKRSSSEPALFLEIMARRDDWAVIVALVGSGQEINRGEAGLQEWGAALEEWCGRYPNRPWRAFVAPSGLRAADPLRGLLAEAGGQQFPVETDDRFHLKTSVRSHRAEALSEWVDAVLEGAAAKAYGIAAQHRDFPVWLTRRLPEMREWLRAETRGYRRCGLVASSGARRLRAEGLGVAMRSNELDDVAHWFLAGRGDIRASYALEVTASEFTCQGLELDYVGLCWGGDMVFDVGSGDWAFRKLSGSKWQIVRNPRDRQYIRNKYRVLMTRARSASVIWIPKGSSSDPTRDPGLFDATAEFLLSCGARPVETRQIG